MPDARHKVGRDRDATVPQEEGVSMAGPVVFISRSRIRDGRLADFGQHFRNGVGLVESGKPNTVLFHAFLDEDGETVEIVHVFPDAEAMDLHMAGAGERAKAAWEYLEPEGFTIYGVPSDGVLTRMREIADAGGIDLQLRPRHLGGFTRLSPG
jgi:hypothetical protein